MAEPTSSAAFSAGIPAFTSFADIVEPDRYRPLPDDWFIGIADVTNSTEAIAGGRYKAVNMAGAAVIAAVGNALDGLDFLFVFGGDGASFAIGPGEAAKASAALAAVAAWVREDLDLGLRVAMVPVAAIRAAGLDIRAARFAPSPDVAYAMFSGGGLAWAEGQMKQGAFALPPAPPGTRPDLSGLSCRFEQIPAARGVVLSLIAAPAPGGDLDAYRRLVTDILGLVESSPEAARPIPPEGPSLRWPSVGLELEARASQPTGRGRILHRADLLVRSLIALLVFRFGWKVGRFDPGVYLGQLVANSDYRKYDDGLRLTLDCTPDLADRLEERLARGAQERTVRFGTHRQAAAMMTCITPSIYRGNHIHFVDGAAGGYASAARQLKQPTIASGLSG